MNLVLGRSEDIAAWVGSRVGARFFPPWEAIGLTSDGRTLDGGIVCHDFNGATIELTVVLGRRLRRSEIRGIYHYLFAQLGVRRLTFRTMPGNAAALRFLDRHATFEAMLPAWFPNGDAVQYRMTPDDPRWNRWRLPA